MKSTDLSDIESQDLTEKMKIWFLRFAEQTAGSKMYKFLSANIAEDLEVMNLASKGNHAQPIPNLLFAAINYLLYQNPESALRKYYPNHGGDFQPSLEFLKEFRQFCISHAHEIIPILKGRSVQTNEVRRCALFLPAFSMIAKTLSSPTFTVIDVGTSGGLNLLFDQFCYDYGSIKIENNKSSLTLNCEIKSSLYPSIKIPNVGQRFGIDINPINLNNDDEALWAKSLVWPDQPERIQRLINAIDIRKKHKLDLRTTVKNEALQIILGEVDFKNEICVMHSFTLNQFTPDQRFDFENVLNEFSMQKPIWRMSLEWIGTHQPELVVQKFDHGKKTLDVTIAECHGHGDWIDFKNVTLF